MLLWRDYNFVEVYCLSLNSWMLAKVGDFMDLRSQLIFVGPLWGKCKACFGNVCCDPLTFIRGLFSIARSRHLNGFTLCRSVSDLAIQYVFFLLLLCFLKLRQFGLFGWHVKASFYYLFFRILLALFLFSSLQRSVSLLLLYCSLST